VPGGPGGIEAPSAPAAAPDDSEELARLRALREAEAQRLREVAQAEEAERQKRLKSKLLVIDGDKQGDTTDPAAAAAQADAAGNVDMSTTQSIGDTSATSDRIVLEPSVQDGAAGVQIAQARNGQGEDQQTPSFNPNEAFLDRAAKRGVDTSIAGKLARPDAVVAEGTIIHGVLESAINSDLPGNVRGVVSQDVWSLDGRRILIPRGARLIGEYSAGIQNGQTRILIAWNRVITGNGITVQLGSIGTDALGRSGMTGIVDRKTIQRYGSALLLTLVGGASQYIATLGQPPEQPTQTISRVDPVTGVITTTTIEGNTTQSDARAIAAQTMSQALTQMANEALQRNISIPPTIHVRQGERIIVMVRRDLDFSKLYRDPVYEEYLRLKGKGRGSVIK
jgi:type IV secretion system protein VirB10